MLLGKELHTKKNVVHEENDNLGLPKKLIKAVIMVINNLSCLGKKKKIEQNQQRLQLLSVLLLLLKIVFFKYPSMIFVLNRLELSLSYD